MAAATMRSNKAIIAVFGILVSSVLADVANRAYLPPTSNNAEQKYYNHQRETLIRVVNVHNTQYSDAQQNNGYLSPVKEIRVKHVYKTPKYLPPFETNPVLNVPDTKLRPPAYVREQSFNQPQNVPMGEKMSSANAIFQRTSQSTAYQGHEYLPPNNIPATRSQNKGPEYLPPHNSAGVQTEKNQLTYKEYEHSINQQSVPDKTLTYTFKAPTYLPPGYDFQNPNNKEETSEVQQQVSQQNGKLSGPFQLELELPPGYDFVRPPAAEEAIAELHTLPADNNDGQHEESLDVMYSGPGYIPPTTETKSFMASNSLHTNLQSLTTLTTSARYADNSFGQMQQHYQKNAAGKIRTVQIVNADVVKTWKVLETKDHSGVKTLKILGRSNENPMGSHHIVNVEIPGANTQMVKIFNDQRDITLPLNGNALDTVTHENNHNHNHNNNNYNNKNTFLGNDYLPPASSRVSRKRSVRVSSESYYSGTNRRGPQS